MKKGISVNPQCKPPVTLGESCYLSADFGFRRHKFSFLSVFFLFPFQGCIKAFGWAWERDIEFDSKVVQVGTNRRCLRWVDWRGNLVPVSSEVTANSHFRSTVLKVSRGEALGDVGDLLFRDPNILGRASYSSMLIAGKKLLWGVLRYISLKS